MLINEYLRSRGVSQVTTGNAVQMPQATEDVKNSPFAEKLKEKLSENPGGVEFSKHAAQRIEQRQIEISADSLHRLNEGVRIAQQKGLDDTLILIDKTAFIVSAQNNKVITTVSENDIKGNVFTNIDGTVIV